MVTFNSRATAASLLAKCLENNTSFSHVLQQQTTQIDPFVHNLCYTTLRWYPTVQFIINKLLDRPLRSKEIIVQCLLLCGITQLKYLGTAQHAAVSETAEAARQLNKPWAVKLINAILQQYLRTEDTLTNAIQQDLVALYAHPAWLIQQLQSIYPDNWQDIIHNNNQHPPLTLRINLQKISKAEYIAILQQETIEYIDLADSPTAIILQNPLPTHKIPYFSAGYCSIQDAASQYAINLFAPQNNDRVLDACCAPGGKACHMLEIAPDINLLAIEQNPARCVKITENLQRLQIPLHNMQILTNDSTQPTTWWDGNLFDKILLDAPCSATGIIRRQPDIKCLRNLPEITACAQQQALLLKKLWPLLKTSGTFMYATCSILPEENIYIINDFIHNTPGSVLKFSQQILPGKHYMDGFFIAILTKN